MAQHKARTGAALALILGMTIWQARSHRVWAATPDHASSHVMADSMAQESDELPADLPDPDSGAERIGRPAPEFAFARWARGGPLRVADLRGKVVLVRFWTDHCRFCRATLPSLEGLRGRYGRDGFVVIGAYHPQRPHVKRSNQQILRAARALGFDGPVAVDQDWATLDRWWLDGHSERNWLSASFLIDRAGIVRWVQGGGEYHASTDPRHARCDLTYRDLEKNLAALLAEPSLERHPRP